ncbi:MAG TPA: dienelactone hydrolase family protein [Candidatus Limnocylindrales bacterium]|nr:dienelactone hydrolase family protein [Candidatus Limnocylindrales bacterium]
MAKGDIVTREVTYAGHACSLKAYVAEPVDAESSPAAIVVQEWWGLNEHIRDVARRLAREGYFAIAPDLYSRQGYKVATDPNTAAQLMGGLKKEDGIADLQTTVEWLRAQKETRATRIGITGFCMGGSYATLLPCESKEIAAAAPFYGEIPADEKLAHLGCPIFYAYGENDGWIQRADVDRLAAALKKFDKKGEVKIYKGCSHGFFNDTRPDVYRAEEAKDAWERTLKLFAANLKK